MELNQQHIHHYNVPLGRETVPAGTISFEGDAERAIKDYNTSQAGAKLERPEENLPWTGRSDELFFAVYKRENGGVLVVAGNDPDKIDSAVGSFLEKTLVTPLPFD